MEPKAGGDIQVVDKRRLQNADGAIPRRPVPLGRRAHSVLLGYFQEDEAREFLQQNALDDRTCNELMEKWDRAKSRIQKLPPIDDQLPATLPLIGAEAVSEVERS